MAVGLVCNFCAFSPCPQTPRSLSKGPLGSELFLPNPQYAVGLGQGLGLHGVPLGEALGEALSAANPNAQPVTLISHRAITLQESIGEGCFGKVYRGKGCTEGGRRRPRDAGSGVMVRAGQRGGAIVGAD